MAEVTSFTGLRAGVRSLTARATLSGGANDTIDNAKLVAAAPATGALRSFLTATYANATAVENAFNSTANSGAIILMPRTGAGVAGLAWTWVASNSTPSVQLVNAAAAGTFDVEIQLDHSINQ